MSHDQYSEFYNVRKTPEFAMPILSFWHKRMLKIAKKNIPDLFEKTILEIGPGLGSFAEICQKNKINYCGYEMNQAQAALLKEKGYNVNAAIVPPIPLGEPVEVIWLSHMLEHASSYPDARQILLSCFERLDPGGYVVIIGPDIHHWKTEFWDCDWSHGFPTSLNRVEELLNETGFSVHKSMHHTCTLTNSFFAWFLSIFFRLMPINFFDWIFYKLTKINLCHRFMHVFGLRQIYVIGKK